MARKYTVSTGLQSLAASTTRVAVQLATGTNVTNSIIGFDATFDSVATGAGAIPVKVQLVRETGASNTTGTAPTPTKWNKALAASVTTARINDTVDGASPTIIAEWLVSPTTGYSYQFPLGREVEMDISDFLTLRLISQSGMTTCNYSCQLHYEEQNIMDKQRVRLIDARVSPFSTPDLPKDGFDKNGEPVRNKDGIVEYQEFKNGDIIKVTAETAEHLIISGQAEPVGKQPQMARLYNNGAELQSTTMEISGSSFSPAIDTTLKRSGAASYKFTAAGSARYFEHVVNGADTILFSRIYVNFTSFPSAISMLLWHISTTGPTIACIAITTSGTLQLRDGDSTAAQIGSDSSTLSLNTWYCIELNTNNGAATEVTARLETATFASGAMTSANNARRVGCGYHEAITGTVNVDDVSVNDASGTAQNSWCGSGKLIRLNPNAAGDANTFATQTGGTVGAANNFTRVSETTPDDATTFNGSNTTGQEDMFNMTDSGIGASDTVNVVQINARSRASVAGSNSTYRLQVKKASGGTVGIPTPVGTFSANSTITWVVNFLTTPNTYNDMFYTDPDGAAWTQATLDTMQAGYKIVTGSTNRADISTLWAYVDYTPYVSTHTLVQQKTGSNLSTTALPITTTSNTVTGDTIIVGIIGNTATDQISSVTATGMTFAKNTSASGLIGGGAASYVSIWVAENITGATTPTITINKSATWAIEAVVNHYRGLATSSIDKVARAGNTTVNASSGNTTTLTQAPELVVGIVGSDAGTATYTLGGGYGNLAQIVAASGDIAIEDEVVLSTAAVAATMTLSTVTDSAAAVLTFKIATIVTVPPKPITRVLQAVNRANNY